MGGVHDQKTLIFIGKGGVGKTTCAAAAAMGLAGSGRKVLLASLDPAHNLGDIFEIPLNDKPTSVSPGLFVLEVNIELAIQRYLDQTVHSMKSLYRYHTVFNLDKFMDVMKHAPGIEEYATLETIRDIQNRQGAYEYIIFDTAPTGLTLKVLTLPEVSLTWVGQLLRIRKRILSQRRQVAHVKGEQHFKGGEKESERIALTEEEDRVLKELMVYYGEMEKIKDLFTSKSQTVVAMVMNPDRLSLFETTRAIQVLSRFDIRVRALILNKVMTLTDPPIDLAELLKDQEEVKAAVQEQFNDYDFLEIPYRLCHLRGKNELDFLAPSITHFILPMLEE